MVNNTVENKNKKNEKGLGRGLGSLLGGGADSGMMGQSFSSENVEAVTNQKVFAQKSQSEIKETPVQIIQGNVKKDLNHNKEILTHLISQQQKSTELAADEKNKVWMIPIDKIVNGKYQPRKEFTKEALLELSQSIKENGVLQPIIVRKAEGGKFEIIAGERRWRASQLAGNHEVPALIKEFTDQKSLELAIIENVQREDLNPIEEAEAYMRLSEEFDLSQQQIAEKVGKERATIANALRLLALPRQIHNMIIQKELSVGHAKVLLSIPDIQKQIEFAKSCVSEKLSVRKLEKKIADFVAEKANSINKLNSKESSSVTQKLIQGLAEELQKILSTKVDIDYKNSKGKLSIHFYSDDELTQLVDRIKK